MRRGIRTLDDESGQALILGAFFMVATFVLIAVLLDVGGAWTLRRGLQNDADAAALAGAQLLPDENAARAVALDYATTNISNLDSPPIITFGGGSGSDGEGEGEDDNGVSTWIRVEVHKTSKTGFAAGVGIGDQAIGAHARAMIQSALLPGPGVAPLAISNTTYQALKNSSSVVTLNYNSVGGTGLLYRLVSINGSTTTTALCDLLKGGSPAALTDPGTRTLPSSSVIPNLHDCLLSRMTAAQANVPACYTQTNVAPQGTLLDHCNPLIGAGRNASGLQSTAVVIIPVLTDATFSASADKAVSLQQAAGGARTFAAFLIDATTLQRVNGVGPTCSGSGACNIRGRFSQNFNAEVLPSGTPMGSFVASSVAKVVQLVE
jgi:hypothetical protein